MSGPFVFDSAPNRFDDPYDLDPQLRADFEAVFGALPRPFPPYRPDFESARAREPNWPRANTGD